MTNKRSIFTVAAAAAFAVFSVGAAPAQEAAGQTMWQWDWANVELPQGHVADDIPLGAEDAPVTMIEYASFTCSHCRDFHNDTFGKLKSEYIDTGKLRFIQRDVYFDAVGLGAGLLARCNGADKYYAISDVLFTNQDRWIGAKTLDEFATNLRKEGAKVGLTDAQMDACWSDKQVIADLTSTFQANAAKDKVEGTPTIMIDGEVVKDRSWSNLQKVIDEKVAAAAAK